jgi:hypothetical protein
MAAAATNTTETEEYVSLKLLLNEKGNKVLFAEAGKDFVDILCSFLTMPLGTIARLVQKESTIGPVTVGCLNSLYKSVADMDQGCFSTDVIQQMLLQPINSAEDYCNTLKHNIDDSRPVKFFVCDDYTNSSYYHVKDIIISTNKDKHKCHCGKPFTLPVFFKHSCQGFVSTDATFVITDNLTVRPNTIDYTSFSLLQEFGINSLNSVKEVVVSVPKEKVL